MAYPPTIPAATRTNATVALDTHPADHNALATALTNMPWGRAAGVINSGAAQTGITTAAVDLTGLSVAATLVVGRRYRIGFTVTINQLTANGVSNVILADGTNLVLTQPGTFVPANGYATVTGFYELVAAVTARTFKLRAATNGGSLTIMNGTNNPSLLVVDDVGL